MLNLLSRRSGPKDPRMSGDRLLLAGIVSSDRVLDGSVAAGLVESRRIVEPGSVRRRPPAIKDREHGVS